MIDAIRGFNAIKAKLDTMDEEEKIAYLTRMGFTLEDKENMALKRQELRRRRMYPKYRTYGRTKVRVARGNKKR